MCYILIASVNRLASLETLNGSDGSQLIFGFLSQLKEGEYYLEDANSQVKLDLSKLVSLFVILHFKLILQSSNKMSPGLFIEGALVLCRGIVYDGCFVVESLNMPPPETREETGMVLDEVVVDFIYLFIFIYLFSRLIFVIPCMYVCLFVCCSCCYCCNCNCCYYYCCIY
jgi:hypothetical protein